MAKYKGIVTTDAGLELLAKACSGGSVKFTAVKTGDGAYDGTEDLSGMTALKSEKQSFGVSGITRIGTQVRVRSVLSNEGLTTGYNITEVGLFATDPDTGSEFLYAIIVSETGLEDYLPPHEDSPSSITMEIYLMLTETENDVKFTAEVVAGTYASAEAFQEFVDNVTRGTTQVGNAKTLDGHEAEYFVTKDLSTTAITLYVDNINGSDDNDGLTASTPIKTITANSMNRYTNYTSVQFKLLTDYTGKITLPRLAYVFLLSNDSSNHVTVNGTINVTGISYASIKNINIVSTGTSDFALSINGSNVVLGPVTIDSAYVGVTGVASNIQINSDCSIKGDYCAISSQKSSVVSIDDKVTLHSEKVCVTVGNGGICHFRTNYSKENSTVGATGKFLDTVGGIITVEGILQNPNIIGTYNGNGSATARQISVGGTGIEIYLRSSAGADLNVGYHGAHGVAVDGTPLHYTGNEINFRSGIININSDKTYLNGNGVTNTYSLL